MERFKRKIHQFSSPSHFLPFLNCYPNKLLSYHYPRVMLSIWHMLPIIYTLRECLVWYKLHNDNEQECRVNLLLLSTVWYDLNNVTINTFHKQKEKRKLLEIAIDIPQIP